MKKPTTALLVLTAASVLRLSADLPEDWEVDLAAQPPKVFTLQRPRGETYELKAVLKRHGKPFEPAITNACIYWQTNGMENLYWSAPASVSSNVLRATWLPSMDPGATTVRGYIGDPGHIYAAAFQFRFIASPGPLPNELPLPQKVIDFAKVRVLNPPWSGGGGGVDTNAVIDIIHATVDGAARPLPKYLHVYNADDSYPAEAEEYYRSRGDGKTDGGCSSIRSGDYLYRNFDFPFDERAEFVVKMSAGPGRFASVGVAQVGTNLTEDIVTSGKPEYSARYKWLPGATVDGINEHGVACNINVCDGDPHLLDAWPTNGTIHCLGAVRWVLDNATNAASAAQGVAAGVYFPAGWAQNYHWMIADERETWIVENGEAHQVAGRAVMTNFPLYPAPVFGSGWERYLLLTNATENITNAWYTRAYLPDAETEWLSEFGGDRAYMNAAKIAWASKPREAHRGEIFQTSQTLTWWQTVHTSIYDLTNRTLRVAVQETDDWYTFQVPSAGGVKVDAYTKAETDAKLAPIRSSVSSLQSSKADQSEVDQMQETLRQAYSIAANAQSTADAAQSTANQAVTDAANAQSTANTAQYTASTAEQTGWLAQQLANAAYSAAVEAKAVISATNSVFSNAVNAVTATTIRREVSASLNTYVDGETGVEYEGKFYDGSLYYVPTGNVYPPNN